MAQVMIRGIHAPHPAGGLKPVQTALLPFCDSGHPCPSPCGRSEARPNGSPASL